MKKNFILLITLLTAFVSQAQVKLGSPFGDNMVLQQNADVAIWGSASPGCELKIVAGWNIHDTTVVSVDHFGKWKAQLKTIEAGGPYEIQILGDNGYLGAGQNSIRNVMLGEVWLCSGQSNMEWTYSHGLGNPEKEIPAANYPDIRIYTVPKVASAHEQDHCGGSWEVCTPEVMKRSSAVAYFYARQLHKKLGVPVGVVVSAWGGTNAEVWVKESAIQADEALLATSRKHQPQPWWPCEPGVCYNSMIYPLVPFTFAGFIWYQGEANAGKGLYPTYDALMRTLIQSWRNDFGADLPFYFVQIAPFKYNEEGANYLREQQARTALYENTGMIVISDLIDGNVQNIHPLNKWDVGDRLANLALAKTYHQTGFPYLYPRFDTMEVRGKKAYLSFTDCTAPLQIKGKQIQDLQVAGEDGVFVNAEAKVEKDKLVVWSKQVKKIKAVRYAFTNTAIGNLFSAEGLPVIPFRTDTDHDNR